MEIPMQMERPGCQMSHIKMEMKGEEKGGGGTED
jgi:hypothetical protein